MVEKKSRSTKRESKKQDVAPKGFEEPPAKTPPKPVVAAPPVKPQPRRALVTFTRWFNARGYKPHWKAGMAVHARDLKARRTPEEWDRLFETY